MSDLQALTPEGTQHLIEKVKTEKEDAFRFSTMPTASEDNLGQVVQYLGESTQTYTQGTSYKCVAHEEEVEGETVTTYAWEVFGGVKDSRIVDGILKIDAKLDSDFSIRPFITVDKDVFIPKIAKFDEIEESLKFTDQNYTGNSTYTADNNRNVLAICSVTNAEFNCTSASFSFSSTGEQLKADFDYDYSDVGSQTKEDNIYIPPYGGIAIGQYSLQNGESLTVTSSGGGYQGNMGCRTMFLPLQSAQTIQFLKSGMFDPGDGWSYNKNETYEHTFTENGHYLFVHPAYATYGESYPITDVSMKLNNESIVNSAGISLDNNHDSWYFADFLANSGDVFKLSETVRYKGYTAFYILKLS